MLDLGISLSLNTLEAQQNIIELQQTVEYSNTFFLQVA